MNDLELYTKVLNNLPLCDLTNISFEELGNDSNIRTELISTWLDMFNLFSNPVSTILDIISHYEYQNLKISAGI